MATPSGTIATSDVNSELGRSPTLSLNFNERVIRQLANSVTNANMSPASTSISMNDMRGKSRIQTQTLSAGSYYTRLAGGAIAPNTSTQTWTVSNWYDLWEALGKDPYVDSSVTMEPLDIQMDATSNLRADPSNWAITSSGGKFNIKLTMSGTGSNVSTAWFLGFFDRTGIGSTWIPPNPPLIYSDTNRFDFVYPSYSGYGAWSLTSQFICWNEGISGASAVAWTLSRMKTAGTNNCLSLTPVMYPVYWEDPSTLTVSSVSVTVETSIN